PTEIYTLSLHDALPILKRIHFQMLADGAVGVVAQPLGVGDRDQEQIQSPSTVVGAGKVIVADQPMVNPTEAGGNLAQPLRPQRMLADHIEARQSFAVFPGSHSPECSGLEVAVGGRWPRCPLVTYCP